VLNARLAGPALRRRAQLVPSAERLFAAGVEQLHLSARGATRVLRVARTIADLGGRETLTSGDVAEALQFRGSDGGEKAL
jgi:magnesium chelatase family protein